MSPGRAGEPDEPGDAALLRAHRDGDPEAFGVLFARHRDRLWSLALRTTGNREDAADALQEAMISAFRRAEGYRGEAQVTTWLHRIVVNACLDRLRRAKVRAARPLPEDLDEHSGREAGLEMVGSVTVAGGDPHSDPEAGALAAERRRAVLAALGGLGADQRAALVLVDMEGYSVEEAGALLGCPTGTVKSRCSRGRARLAEALVDLAPEGTATSRPGPAPSGTTPPPDASQTRTRSGTTTEGGPADERGVGPTAARRGRGHA